MWRCIHKTRHGMSRFIFSVLSLVLVLPTAITTTAQSMGEHSERVPVRTGDIARDPSVVPASVGGRPAKVVTVPLVTREITTTLDPSTGATYRYWTFNGKVPGPMIRVRQGDTVEVTLHNEAASHMVHSVDFHAVIGPGGGTELSQVLPGQTKTFTFQATTPGLFVYHCGTPMVADHIANGMYGLILVESPGGLSHVDREYYIMQGEIYTTAPRGKSGLQTFSEAKLISEAPEYFVFNGAVDALLKQYPLQASVGETVRIFFGNAGPNETSSLHVVGEIFTRDYVLGSLASPPLNSVSTANVPPGSAVILELRADMPGHFTFMDHAMSRMAKGLIGVLDVEGNEVARLMYPGGASVTGTPPNIAIAKRDADAAELSSDTGAALDLLPESDFHSTSRALDKPHSPRRTNSKGLPLAGTTAARESVDSAEINGCLTRDGQMPKLTLFHSRTTYRLQARPMLLNENPLLFANNFNTLVHVTGRLTHLADTYDADHGPVFEINAVDQLAPTCKVTASLAQLRHAQQKRSHRPQLVSARAMATNHVHMSDMAFVPASIEVGVGQQVVWQNTSSGVHNVVDNGAKALDKVDVARPVSAKPFDSGYLQPGQSFARVFNQPGIYRYVCTLHEANGMKGVIVVRPRTSIADAGPDSALRQR